MEVATAGSSRLREQLDITPASVALAALSPLSVEPHHTRFSGETARLAAQRGAAEAREGGEAAGWARHLGCVCHSERLRMHATCLENCFSPLQQQLSVLAARAADVSSTCGAAAQQLQQTLTSRRPVLHALRLLRDRRLLLQERQRLCGLLCEQLRLSSPLLHTVAAVEAADKNSRKGGHSLYERYFDALEELQQIREKASSLQRLVAPSHLPGAAGASVGADEAATPALRAASTTGASFHSSLLRRRALAEAVLQQAGELQELAYERLYLWLQQECRTASAAATAAPPRAGRAQAVPESLRDADSGSINSTNTAIAAVTTAEAAHFPAFFAALASSGVAAAVCGSQSSSTGAVTTAKAAETDALHFFLAGNSKRKFSAATDSHGRTVTEGSEGLRNNGLETRAPPADRTQAASLQWPYRLRQPVPLLLRTCFTLQARPPYLSHCLQELLHVRQKDVEEHFYRLLSAPSSATCRGAWVFRSSGNAALAVCGGRDGGYTCNGVGGEGYYVSNTGSSTRLAYLKRSHPLRFLQGLLQSVTAVAARERAVVAGLQQLLLPARSEPYAAAHSETAGAAEETIRVAMLAAAEATEKRNDGQYAAETTGKLQLIGGSGAVSGKRATRDDSLKEHALGVLDEYNRPDSVKIQTLARDVDHAENDNDVLTMLPSSAASQTNASAAGGSELTKSVISAVETMRSTDMLEWLLCGVAQIFEQQLEEVFAAVQQQQKRQPGRGAGGGERHQQRPACTVSALAMAHLLDRHAVLMRRLLLFDRDLNEERQQGRGVQTSGNDGSHDLLRGVAEAGAPTTPELVAEDMLYSCTSTLPEASSVSGEKEAASAYGDMVHRNLPGLINCCETYAEKAELLFLSLWEAQVVCAASSGAREPSSGFVLPFLRTRDSAMISRESKDNPAHPTGCSFGTPRIPALLQANEYGKETDLEPSANVKLEDGDIPFLDVMDSLEQALELLHAPLSGWTEEAEASAAVASFLWIALEDSRDAAQQRSGVFPKSKSTKECVEDKQQSAVPSRLVNDAFRVETAAGETSATTVPRPLVEVVLHFFEGAAAVCRRTPGRRSRITGLRITERFRPLQENESHELDAWVESSVAPLLNFCRQETRHFSDAGDAAVFLVNAYSSIEAPLRRFAVCRVYGQLLEELIGHQIALLHQVETKALLSRLELDKTLEAVQREVGRRKWQKVQNAALGGEGGDQGKLIGPPVGRDAVDETFHANAVREEQNVQWRGGGPATWDFNDDVQVGGALSPAELCLQEAALARFFKKFSSVLYALDSVELRYIGRIIQAKRRLEARRLVLKDVVAAYAEVYICTKHLGLAVHTPGEVALLIAT